MTVGESHYLICMERDCAFFACVARRDYESKLDRLYARYQRLERAAAAVLNPMLPKAYLNLRSALRGVTTR